jgi:hypothetical protein
VQLTTDGFKAYLVAVEGAFGSDINYATLTKIYGVEGGHERRYSPAGSGLWPSNLGSIVCNNPITYVLDGKQYIVVASGDTLYAFSLYQPLQSSD